FVSTFLFFFSFYLSCTSDLYTLSLHDALPICPDKSLNVSNLSTVGSMLDSPPTAPGSSVIMSPSNYNITPPERKCSNDLIGSNRSEEHTSELQSRFDLVCRLLLEKKKINVIYI